MWIPPPPQHPISLSFELCFKSTDTRRARFYIIHTNSAICLEAVNPSQTIHSLKCHHVFHDRCLEGWFLECHFDCPLCHAVFFYFCAGNNSTESGSSDSGVNNMV